MFDQPDSYNARGTLFPEIIRQQLLDLLLCITKTAAYTLARLLGLRLANDLHISRCTPNLQPRTAAYTALVQTVKPYLPLFLEDHLKSTNATYFLFVCLFNDGFLVSTTSKYFFNDLYLSSSNAAHFGNLSGYNGAFIYYYYYYY